MTFKSGLFGALLAVVGASYLATNPAKADLGSADITGPSSAFDWEVLFKTMSGSLMP